MVEVQPHYKQFDHLAIPADIKPLPILSKEEINKKVCRYIDISKNFNISLNTNHYYENEIQLHTVDIGSTIAPDFDFTFLDEYDVWRKICKLKFSLRQIKEVDLIRCEHFFQKMQVCESLTLFEEVHRMLKVGGSFLITVLDFHKLMKFAGELNPGDFKNIHYCEKTMFSASDSTGIYYNRTIWTYERLSYYLKLSKFTDIKNLSDLSETPNQITISARKDKEIDVFDGKDEFDVECKIDE